MSEVTLTREDINSYIADAPTMGCLYDKHGEYQIGDEEFLELLHLALRALDMERVFNRILKQVEVSQANEAEKPEAKYTQTVAWLGFMHIKDAINEHRTPNTKGQVT